MSIPTFNARFTHAQRKVVAELLPDLADRLLLNTSNQRTLPFTLDELKAMQQKAQEIIRRADTGMKRNSLCHIIEATTKAIDDSQCIGSIPAADLRCCTTSRQILLELVSVCVDGRGMALPKTEAGIPAVHRECRRQVRRSSLGCRRQMALEPDQRRHHQIQIPMSRLNRASMEQ